MNRLLLLLSIAGAGDAVSSEVRVAFVGNSYTYFNDLPSMFAKLSASANIAVTHAQVTPGGTSLFQHANTSISTGSRTEDMLQDPNGWDYVVLQDQSETPGGGRDTDDNLAPGVGRTKSIMSLHNFYARRLRAAGAVGVLYQTWGRRDGDPPNADCCGYGDFLSMNSRTAEGYSEYAAALEGAGATVRIAPCGRAFELAHNATAQPLESTAFFSCLYHHGAAGCTPDTFGRGGHPSPLGTYLIACTLFGTIHGRSPKGLEWAPAGVSAADQAAAQNFAATALRAPAWWATAATYP